MTRFIHMRTSEEGVDYRLFTGTKNKGAFGGATIAYNKERNLFGVSACSTKDHFEKAKGREYAEARLDRALTIKVLADVDFVVVLPSAPEGSIEANYVDDAVEFINYNLVGEILQWGTTITMYERPCVVKNEELV